MVVLADDAICARRDLNTSLEKIDLAVSQFGALLHAMCALGNDMPPDNDPDLHAILTLQTLLLSQLKQISTHTQSAWQASHAFLPAQGAA